MKLTVKEYATKYNISIQSVYKRIKRGTLNTVKENNIIYVVLDVSEVEEVVAPVQSNDCTELLDIIRRRDKENKQLQKEIKRLTKKNEAVFTSFLDKALAPPVPKDERDFVDVAVEKSKKPKKKKEKFKKKKKKNK